MEKVRGNLPSNGEIKYLVIVAFLKPASESEMVNDIFALQPVRPPLCSFPVLT